MLSRRYLIAVLFACVLAAQDDQPTIFSASVRVVNVLASVRDKHGAFIRDLARDDFTLLEDGRPQDIRYFSRETNLPLTLGLMVDTSMSQHRLIETERSASYRFLDKVLGDKDQVFIMQFDMAVQMARNLTSSRKQLEDSLAYVDTPTRAELQMEGMRGGTLLYDAVLKACRETMKNRTGRKALIVLSDGGENGSDATLEEAIDAAQLSDTLVYSIYFADPAYQGFGEVNGRAVLKRMAQYANNTIQARVQSRVAVREVNDASVRKLASYLATINLGRASQWDYELQTLPRPKGRAAHVVITEYELPRQTIAPHDVRTDAQGNVWYSNFVENFLGELDPRTGANRDYAIPVLKPDFPTGTLDLEADAEGNLWLAMMFQAGLARFDMTTKTFRIFPVQSELNDDAMQQSMVMPHALNVDGKVWTNDVARQAIMRLDLETGLYQRIDPFKLLSRGHPHSPYGMAADAGDNLYFMDFGDENIGRVDARSGAITIYPTPTPKSRPRRTMLDGQGRLWFTEFAANKLAMFDLKAESFKEWNVPTPHTYPYDVFADKNGELWSGGMASDRVLRFDPQSGRSVEYLLPRSTNIRRVFVDNSTNPVTFWAGNNHGAEILRIEPLD